MSYNFENFFKEETKSTDDSSILAGHFGDFDMEENRKRQRDLELSRQGPPKKEIRLPRIQSEVDENK